MGGKLTASVVEEHSGVRAQGHSERQKVRVGTHCTSGYYRLAFAQSGWSSYIAYDASSAYVEKILETLPSIGDVSVSKNNTGNIWIVTFLTNVWNVFQGRPLINSTLLQSRRLFARTKSKN